jgi:hypothetical protein
MSKTRRANRQPVVPQAKRRQQHGPNHQARWDFQPCNACARLVISAEERTENGRLKGALLEGGPDNRGTLVRDDAGYIIHDLQRQLPGNRYLWHNCPARNSPGKPEPAMRKD